MNCKHCGDKLSSMEEFEVRQNQAEQTCEECFLMMETSEPAEETWDSDSGL